MIAASVVSLEIFYMYFVQILAGWHFSRFPAVASPNCFPRYEHFGKRRTSGGLTAIIRL